MKVLVDTSVWIDHLHVPDPRLIQLAAEGNLLCHSFVLGELACGNLANRDHALGVIARLPALQAASDAECLSLLGGNHLWGKGLGWSDVHLLASCVKTGTRLWTRDKALHRAAVALGVAATN